MSATGTRREHRSVAATVLLIIAMGAVMSTAAPAQDGSQIKVEIKPLQSIVKNMQALSVTTKLRNIGRDDQTIQTWSCSYPSQWTTDNPFVRIEERECHANALIDTLLKSGEAYERDLSVRVSLIVDLDFWPSAVTFRLGFMPWAMADRLPITYWSNPITIIVKE
jgi:hypothetical protein